MFFYTFICPLNIDIYIKSKLNAKKLKKTYPYTIKQVMSLEIFMAKMEYEK